MSKSVLVVHGVGVEHPGVSMLDLTTAVCDHRKLTHSAAVEQIALEGPGIVFSAQALRISTSGDELRFAELYWGDLSQVKRSIIGLVLSAFRLIFGLRFIVVALRREQSLGVLPALCNILLLLVLGPILAGSILTIMLVLVGGVAAAASDPQTTERVAGPILAASSFLVGVLLLASRRFPRFNAVARSWTGNWLLFAALIAGAWFAVEAWRGHSGMANALLSAIHVLQRLWALANILSLGCLALTCVLYFRVPRISRPSLLACFAATQLCLAFWAIVVPAIILATDLVVPSFAKFKGWKGLLEEALPTVGIVWTAFLALSIAAAGTWISRSHWKSRNPNPSRDSLKRPPRLILGSGLFATILLAPIWLVSAFFVVRETTGPGESLVSALNRLAIASSPVVLALLLLALPILRIVLAIVLDIVNYLTPDAAEASRIWPQAGEGKLRRCARQRFRAIVQQLLAEQGAGSALVVVAHSQGTVLAMDFVGDEQNRDLLARFSEVRLVTMGSPYTHLYQTYFPTEFGSDRYKGKPYSLTSWTNLYRFDDYVGTDIDCDALSGSATPDNIGLGFGGHTGYFGDKRVIAELAWL